MLGNAIIYKLAAMAAHIKTAIGAFQDVDPRKHRKSPNPVLVLRDAAARLLRMRTSTAIETNRKPSS
jgi:hypothetical protein